jgi:hypothetical protein
MQQPYQKVRSRGAKRAVRGAQHTQHRAHERLVGEQADVDPLDVAVQVAFEKAKALKPVLSREGDHHSGDHHAGESPGGISPGGISPGACKLWVAWIQLVQGPHLDVAARGGCGGGGELRLSGSTVYNHRAPRLRELREAVPVGEGLRPCSHLFRVDLRLNKRQLTWLLQW